MSFQQLFKKIQLPQLVSRNTLPILCYALTHPEAMNSKVNDRDEGITHK